MEGMETHARIKKGKVVSRDEFRRNQSNKPGAAKKHHKKDREWVKKKNDE